MFLGLLKDKYFIPNTYCENIFAIKYDEFYQEGVRLLLIDLDNTLAAYDDNKVYPNVIELINKLKEQGFEIILVSNNFNKERVEIFKEGLQVSGFHKAKKPFKSAYRKAMKLTSRNYQKEEVLAIGDQLMTDVCSANRMGYKSAIVKPLVKKSEVLATKIMRKLENHVLKVFKKKHPKEYQKYLKEYEDNRDD